MSVLTKKITLVCADDGSLDGTQHNKVWHGELYDSGNVITRWGRVGYTLQSREFIGAGESFLLKKEREKVRGGYTHAKIVDAINNTTSSLAKPMMISNLHEIAKNQIAKISNNPVLDRLIERLVKANIHKITSNTNITLNDSTGLFQTPLGIVTPDAISEARKILANTLPYVSKGKFDDKVLSKLVTDYLRLIPQNIGMKFNVERILPDVATVQNQNDILDALDASYQAITKVKPKDFSNKTEEQVFRVDLDLETSNEADRLIKWFESSKKRMHGYDNVKIKNVFKVNIHGMTSSFVSDNIVEVFHGTSEANNLSILKSGIKITPPSTAVIAGKMFGNGVYGAINSTKSLGYTYGRWGQSSGESGWLYICQFAMGKPDYTNSRYGCSRPSKGCNSVWAKASNTGLNHDELIVYENCRVKVTHLLECK